MGELAGLFSDLAIYIVSGLSAAVVWVFKNLRQRNADITDLQYRVEGLERTSLKEEEVKRIVKEILQKYLEDTDEIKKDLKVIAENVVQLRIDMAAVNSARTFVNGKREQQ